MPRILITGSREWSDRGVVRRALEQALVHEPLAVEEVL